jgi:hypothetical protein
MKLSVLIPYRPDSEHRARLYEATRAMWEKTGIEVIYASDGGSGLFSYARAINAARRQATGDWFLSYSVDALPPSKGLLGFLAEMLKSRPWAACMLGQNRFNHHQTELILRGEPPRSKHVGPPAGGIAYGPEAILAVRADVWDSMRGYDEGFVGWGPEDKAWHLALKTIFPSGWDLPTDEFFRTLWHPPVSRSMLPQNMELFREYQLRAGGDPVEFRRWYFSQKSPDTNC